MARSYKPPYQINATVVRLVGEISQQLGRWSVATKATLTPQLRRDHRIRTIQASLAIENNSLTVEQVTAVLAGKRVLGPPREIHEVKNAFSAYDQMANWRPTSRTALLEAHRLLMLGLMDAPGHFRRSGVGIYRGDKIVHMAPPASLVAKLIDQLLRWLENTDTHPLISSCVFHYEFEFIHPFSDGNGRLGRLWQTLILGRWQPILMYLPVETVIRNRQQDYYAALAAADAASDATPFLEFMLHALNTAMLEVVDPPSSRKKTSEKKSEKKSEKTADRLLREIRRNPHLTIANLAALLGISTRSIERNLQTLQESGRLQRVGAARGGHWRPI